ncbi:hypothetical protein F4820DRAFT_430944 [Hypoxylon rubiginosum]|uniref:Uncharacterized protein n=1 Tax=Hypoxylon rubiginosum TaxID=110542 RepID=A0ACB9YSA9_9PEZI|nr:hypothetical protein F4820DRAFT_430944 [Hypoxylon rubiginosum]
MHTTSTLHASLLLVLTLTSTSFLSYFNPFPFLPPRPPFSFPYRLCYYSTIHQILLIQLLFLHLISCPTFTSFLSHLFHFILYFGFTPPCLSIFFLSALSLSALSLSTLSILGNIHPMLNTPHPLLPETQHLSFRLLDISHTIFITCHPTLHTHIHLIHRSHSNPT